MWNKFLHNPFHIVKDYELRKLLWQSGSGTAVCKKYLKFRDTAPEKLTFPETQVDEGLIVTSNYLATNRARRRCDRKVTPFFCVRRLILQYWVR